MRKLDSVKKTSRHFLAHAYFCTFFIYIYCEFPHSFYILLFLLLIVAVVVVEVCKIDINLIGILIRFHKDEINIFAILF